MPPFRSVEAWLLAGLVVVIPFLRGGVDWPVQIGAAFAAAAAAALAARSCEPGGIPLVLVVLAAVTAALAAQLVPLPAGVHRVLSPGATAVFESSLEPIGLYPAWRPLSLDPSATARALSDAGACMAAALAGGLLAGRTRSRELLLGAVAVAGAALAFAQLGAVLAGAAPAVKPRVFFVNPNHMAALLNLSAFAALGFAVRSRGRARAIWAAAFVAAGSGVFLSLSRGGIAAFFAGAGIFTFLKVRSFDDSAPEASRSPAHEGRAARRWRRLGVIGAAACAPAAIAAYLAVDEILARLGTLEHVDRDARLPLWTAGLELIRKFPVTGIGRGAFATVYPAYKLDPGAMTFTHLENDWLQPLVELGIPVGLLLIVAIACSWLRAARQPSLSRLEIGALAGTGAVAVHNVVDFSLDVLGVAVPFAVAVGILSRHQRHVPFSRTAARAAAGAVAILAMSGMALHRAHPSEQAALVAHAPNANEAIRLARAAAPWQPADYLPHAAAGALLVQEGRCAEALPWLQRAMMLSPTAPEPHRFVGRCLAVARRGALARREYRLAHTFGDPAALAEAVALFPALDDLLQVAPETPDGLLTLGNVLARSRPADAAAVLTRGLEEFGDLRALAPLAEATLAAGDHERAIELARKLQRAMPSDPVGYVVASRALTALGQADEARRELEIGAAQAPGALVLLPLAEQLMASRRFAEARRTVDAIPSRTMADVVRKRIFIARALHAQGRVPEAIGEARAAAEIAPTDPAPRLLLAELYAQAGRYDEAIAAMESAAALPGVPADRYAARLAELRAAYDRRGRGELGARAGQQR